MQLLLDAPTVLDQFKYAPITGVLVLAMVGISYFAFNDRDLRRRLLFVPAYMEENGPREWYRFISAGFIHANWMHLIFNALVFWQFGLLVELSYKIALGPVLGSLAYVFLFFAGLVASALYSFFKHRHNYGYGALGASGAVSGVLFAAIVFRPFMPLQFIFLPFVEIPAVVMGIAYLAFSAHMARQGRDNIGHDAHFWGSVWGFAFTCVVVPGALTDFLNSVINLFKNFFG